MVKAEDSQADTTEEINQLVFTQEVPCKGRCLFTKYSKKAGEVIFCEKPVLTAYVVPEVSCDVLGTRSSLGRRVCWGGWGAMS